MKKLIAALYIIIILLSNPFCLSAQAFNEGDSMALVDLYNATNGDNWENKSGWLTKDPLNAWYGIGGSEDRVVEVNLRNNNLKGILPSSLGFLSMAYTIDLSYNFITGSIPSSLSNLGSQLYGPSRLDLSNNSISGTIPVSLVEVINYGHYASSWNLTSNKLTGPLPSSYTIYTSFAMPIYNNYFNFDDIEPLVSNFGYDGSSFSPQNIILSNHGDTLLSADAGGILSTNKYVWNYTISHNPYTDSIEGDSTYKLQFDGVYRVTVTSRMVSNFEIKSDTIPVHVPVIFNSTILDPNPSLITSNGLVSYYFHDLSSVKTAVGAVTDGVSKLLIVVDSKYDSVTFSLKSDSEGNLSDLYNQTTKNTSVVIYPYFNKAVAVYTVPDSYGLSDPSAGIDVWVHLKIKNTKDSILLKLVTPPILLVHGMWSSPSIWDKSGFTTYLQKAGLKKYYLVDYKKYNTVTFDPNNSESFAPRIQLLAAIYQALNEYRDKKIAVSQVDVVGHSLGGLMTRSLSQQDLFFTDRNYYKGYVHKLITLGTPHRGSPFGPELYRQKDTWSYQFIPGPNIIIPYKLSALLELAGMPIGSCHRDFAITSQGIADLTQTPPFKTFAITANHEGGGNVLGETASYLAMEALCQIAFGKFHEEIMKSRCSTGTLPNDLIVPYRSQTGYINSNQTFYGTSHSIPGLLTETNNPLVQAKVTELLLSDDMTKFSTGFPAPSSFPLESCDNATERNGTNQPSAINRSLSNGERKSTATGKEYVQISSPHRGSTYRKNNDTTVTIKYETFSGALPTNALLIIQNVGMYKLPTKAPYSITITLPINVQTGKLSMVLLVSDTTGINLSDTSHITILPGGTLKSISVKPTSIYFDSAYRETEMLIRQEYTGIFGTQINDVSSESEGVVYATQKSESIIKVSANGNVTAVAPGSDTLMATVNDTTFKIPVIVDQNFLYKKLYPNIIDFDTITDKTINSPSFALEATTTSGKDVTFTLVSGPVEIVNGVVTVKGTGTVTIRATCGGNAYFDSAAPVIRMFNVELALPLQLLTFTGSKVNRDVLLNWTTVNEKNTAYFSIEKSTDGIHFLVIGTLRTTANSIDKNNYSFTDKYVDANFPRIFYRLIEVDKDGKQIVSNIVPVTINGVKAITVYPNPAKRTINILFNKLSENNSYVRFYNVDGKTIYTQKLLRQFSQDINLPPVSNGTYRLVIWNNGRNIYQQLIIIAN